MVPLAKPTSVYILCEDPGEEYTPADDAIWNHNWRNVSRTRVGNSMMRLTKSKLCSEVTYDLPTVLLVGESCVPMTNENT